MKPQSYSQAQKWKVMISRLWLLIPMYLAVLSDKSAF